MSFLEEIVKHYTNQLNTTPASLKQDQPQNPSQLNSNNEKVNDSEPKTVEIQKEVNIHESTSNKRNQPIDFLNEAKKKMIRRVIGQWLSPNKDKEYLSVTEVVSCPTQVWLKLSGKLKYEDLEIDKIFHLLDVYARIGDTVHDYIYKLMDFEYKEVQLKDDEYRIRGRFDIIDSGMLIDIKSSMKESNYAPQLALYYYLATKHGYKIDRALIWYVMQDKIQEYDIQYLVSILPEYLHRSRIILQSLKNDTPPNIYDVSQCQYCLVRNKCLQYQSLQSNQNSQKDSIQESPVIISFNPFKS